MSHLRQCSRPGCERKEVYWSEKASAYGLPVPDPPLCRQHLDQEARERKREQSVTAEVQIEPTSTPPMPTTGAQIFFQGSRMHQRVNGVIEPLWTRTELVAALDAEEASWTGGIRFTNASGALAAIDSLRATLLRSDR